jgi:signal transduction histidine kinase
MKFSTFCKDQFTFILLESVCVILITLFLHAFDINPILILLVCQLIIVAFCIGLLAKYMKVKHYFTEVLGIYKNLEEKTLLADIIEKPDFYEGQLFYNMLSAACKDMNDQIGCLKQQQKEYLEYIELWIHEIKTPIAGMELYFNNHKSEENRELLFQLTRIENYIEQVLYFARSSQFNQDFIVEKIELSDLVKSVIKENSLMFIQAGAQIRMDNLTEEVYTDSKWFKYVLKQILENSVKYGKDSLSIEFNSSIVDDKLFFSVKDNGIGIKASDINRVFHKGFTGTQGRNYKKSTGMGLYISKKLCTKLGLNLTIASPNEDGTIVTIEFPYKNVSCR